MGGIVTAGFLKYKLFALIFLAFMAYGCAVAGNIELALPPRKSDALTGSAIFQHLKTMSLKDREEWLFREFRLGNIPGRLRTLVPVTFRSDRGDGKESELVVFVTSDYLSFGSDDDNFHMPMTPMLAQRLADEMECLLPTPMLVDRIWTASNLKLKPRPIPPSPAMTTVPVFWDHEIFLRELWEGSISPEVVSDGAPLLVAGHKKDVVIINNPEKMEKKVFIYGWHETDGKPIQPVYGGHVIWYADYSHGIRLVSRHCRIDGVSADLGEVLRDESLFRLVSQSDRPFIDTAYPTVPGLYPE